ncbi:MAG: hypothetical protein Q9217_001871 [Psora testacea]
MSFLNSVLSSIGKEGASPSPVLPPAGVQSHKRKADGDLTRPNDKAHKIHITSRPSSAPASTLQQPTDDGKVSAIRRPTTQAVPYRGTSKPTTSCTPSPAPVADSSKQLKKGSYKEIMARAQASAAQAKPPVGTISHKPKAKMEISYKKELKMKKAALKDKKLGIIKNGSRPSSSDGNTSSSAPGKAVNGKKGPQPSYLGTAKPKPPKPQPSYKGTMNPAAVPRKTEKPKRSVNEYAATDDELDDDEEEEEVGDVDDGYGYSDEGSDDMEAGFSDVEQEETAAARAARKEDEEEAKLEARLKRDKEERKKRLEGLAKKAKPQRY